MDAETIYLDHAATTPVHARVLDAMLPYFTQQFGNPSGRYPMAEQARAAVDWARQTVATTIGARSSEIVFTGGGSESNNLALQGVAFAARDRGDHIVTTQIEHHAVLRTCAYLERVHGFRVTYLPVDRSGLVDLVALEHALDDRTILVSVMLANNEVGTIQPLAEIAALTRPRGIALHTDAVQALPTLPVDIRALGVDLLTISAHKCYGPKGVGALYVRRGTPLLPQIYGGHQERDRRAGTENVAGIVGLATALQLVRSHDSRTLADLRDRLIRSVLEDVPGAILTGHPTLRLPGHASFCFGGVAGEAVLVALADHGIACSSGSACAAGESEPSHVLTAMGIPDDLAHTAVRLTLGLTNTPEQIEWVAERLPAIVAAVRGVEHVI
ncbi:MAG TPA: cysteine desulfurase family protein [Herpetosiphonaceae bacterium]